VQTSSIIEKGNSNTAGYGLVLVSSGGGLLACEIVPGATSGTYSGASSERIPLNKWTHIAVTYDDSLAAGAKANIFVNGVSSVRKNDAGCGLVSTGVGGIKSDTSAVKIASRQSSTLYFGGYVDQVKVYGYARTAAQIAYDYNRSLPTSWWKMDVGLLHFDDLAADISTLTGDLSFQGGKIKVTARGDLELNTGVIAGNEAIRGALTLNSGQTATISSQNWSRPPKSIVLTPGYKTNVWVENITNNGFRAVVDTAPNNQGQIYWMAIW
jgi:hypothetical protein